MAERRRRAPRRRTFRIKAKWDPQVIGRRFKLYLPIMTLELDWEIEVLELLEQDVYPYLEAQGIPKEEWEHYVAFAKGMWERRVHFNQETFQLEKTSLLNEFTWRGLDPTHLTAIQAFSESRAEEKLKIAPPPKLAEYTGVTALGGNVSMAQWAGVTTPQGVVTGCAQYGGADVLGGNANMAQWGGVTVVRGTVT
jgi:hypothetical protein